METELPRLFGAVPGLDVTFHSARVRMKQVTPEELKAMVDASGEAAESLADMHPDVVAYACLVAVMAQGVGAHERIEKVLAEALAAGGSNAPIVSSAGALIEGSKALGAKRIAVATPYMKPLTAMVIDYLQSAGLAVTDSVSLEVSDNVAVGCIPGDRLLEAVRTLDLSNADALVLSACVQMPSLALVDAVEQEVGIPVLTAATSTTYSVLSRLGMPTGIAGAGALLDGSR
jgi:maleate isomerase